MLSKPLYGLGLGIKAGAIGRPFCILEKYHRH